MSAKCAKGSARPPARACAVRNRRLSGAQGARCWLAALALSMASCSSRPAMPSIEPVMPARGTDVVRFSFQTIDGKQLSTATMAGRIAVIGFVATYDEASQAQARFLTGLFKRHVPRVNVALLVLEAPENRPLVETFVAVLRLPYPAALADAATIAGEGPFKGLHHVPSVVILDRTGREAWRHVGLVLEEDIERAVRAIEASDG